MSWLFSQALAEACSRATFSAGESCAQLNVMVTAQRFSRNGKPMDASRLSRFGLTLQLLTADHGAAWLRWYREVFLVRTSASPEPATDLAGSAPDSGERWLGSFARWDPDTCSWKTPQCSLLEGFTEFSQTWPSSGSMRNGECSERPTLGRPISESESGYLPTPVTLDSGSRFNRSLSEGAQLRPTLGAMARYNLWPIPTVKGNYNRTGLTSTSGDGLATAVRKWPTPTARDYRGVQREQRRHEMSLKSSRGVPLNEAAGGLLNPTWVEWLMGWPIGWTALPPLATDRFREWQQQHGDYSLSDCGAERESHRRG